MLTSPTFTVPGAEGIAAAYAEMRHYGVTPLVASDWLTEQIEATAHQDIAQQVDRNHGAPAERPVTVKKTAPAPAPAPVTAPLQTASAPAVTRTE